MAPTNEAFSLLGETLLDCLLLPRYVEVLQNILLYHVADGLVLAQDLSNNQMISMLNGESIVINIDNGGTVTINENSIVQLANVMATNGVIHAIDRVLVPPDLNIQEFLETCTAPPTDAPTDAPTNAPTVSPPSSTDAPTNAPTLGAACYDSSIRKCKCDAESCT